MEHNIKILYIIKKHNIYIYKYFKYVVCSTIQNYEAKFYEANNSKNNNATLILNQIVYNIKFKI